MPYIPKRSKPLSYLPKPKPRKGTGDQRFTGLAVWKKARAAFIAANPLCRGCEAQGNLTPARVVDHIIARSQGGAELDRRNFMPLCDSCHNTKSYWESRGLEVDGVEVDGGLVPTRMGVDYVLSRFAEK